MPDQAEEGGDGGGWVPLEPAPGPVEGNGATTSGDGNPGWPPPQQPPPGWPPPQQPPPGWPPPQQPPPGWPPAPGWPGPAYPRAGVLPKAGDARTGPLPLHPMTVGDILDGAFKLLKANARTVLVVVAVITFPLQFLTSFVLRESFSPGLFNIFTDPSLAEAAAEQSASAGQVAAQLAAALLSLLATPFIAGAVSRVVAASYLGQQVGPAEALRTTGRRFGALLGGFVLVHLAEGIGVLLCIVPALAVMALFSVVAPAIAVEEIGAVQAMRRSWRLVRPRFWPVLGICILAGLLANVLGSILGFAPQMVGLVLGGSWAWVLIAVAGVLTNLVAAPIVAIVATLVYFDARIRHEGFDLEVMAADLGARAGA